MKERHKVAVDIFVAQIPQYYNDSCSDDDKMVAVAAPVAKSVTVTPIWIVGSGVAVATRIMGGILISHFRLDKS